MLRKPIASAKRPNPFHYCGEYFDSETGTVYLRNRNYDTATGRFSSEDPIQNGLNWYTYCGNEPISFIDPLGLIVTTNNKQLKLVRVSKNESTSETVRKLMLNLLGKEDSVSTTLLLRKTTPSISKTAPYSNEEKYARTTIDIGNGWEVDIDPANTSTKTQKHIHVHKGRDSYAQNDDGSPHDGSKGGPPKKVMKKILDKLGWDWNKKADDWASKITSEVDDLGTLYTFPDGKQFREYHSHFQIQVEPSLEILQEYYNAQVNVMESNNVVMPSNNVITFLPMPFSSQFGFSASPFTMPVPIFG